LFRGEELELLICGSADLDFNELERIAVYLDGYHPQHPTIRHVSSSPSLRNASAVHAKHSIAAH
jgi:hypothetical protein